MISVLIVDDEDLARQTLTRYVKWPQLGVDQVYEASDGMRALKIMEQHPVSIIISDIKMPHMGGLEFARIVRERYPDSRLVFLSGYSDKEYLKGAIHLHVDGYIEKPLNIAEISDLMEKLAQECRTASAKENPALYFYHKDAPVSALNAQIFTLSKKELYSISRHLKSKDREQTFLELRALCCRMRACEGTAPDYVRNVFSQLALRLDEAAALHGAAKALERSTRFVYDTARADCFEQLQTELFSIAGLLFDEIETRDFDPVSQVNEYIHAHYSDSSLTVDSLARHLNFNTSYLCAVYKKRTGSTINETLTATRLRHACRLLETSSLKLYEVGERVGYTNGKYFAKVFRKEIGISPREYRERHLCTNTEKNWPASY